MASIPWSKAFAILQIASAVIIQSHDSELNYHDAQDEGDDAQYVRFVLKNEIHMCIHQKFNKSVRITSSGTMIFKLQYDDMDPDEKIELIELVPLTRVFIK